MISIRTQVEYTQGASCWLCLHVWTVALFFFPKPNRKGPRIEICTPLHWFRYSRGR